MFGAIDQYIAAHSKSQFVGFVLTFFFGPLGLLYSNWIAALFLTIIAVATIGTIVLPIACWLFAILLSFYTVSKYNEKVRAAANLGIIKREPF